MGGGDGGHPRQGELIEPRVEIDEGPVVVGADPPEQRGGISHIHGPGSPPGPFTLMPGLEKTRSPNPG